MPKAKIITLFDEVETQRKESRNTSKPNQTPKTPKAQG